MLRPLHYEARRNIAAKSPSNSASGPAPGACTRAQEEQVARLCAEALGTEAVHRALVRFAQGQLGKDVGVPNDVAAATPVPRRMSCSTFDPIYLPVASDVACSPGHPYDASGGDSRADR